MRQSSVLKSYQDKLIGMSSEIKEPHRSPGEDKAVFKKFGSTLSMIFACLL